MIKALRCGKTDLKTEYFCSTMHCQKTAFGCGQLCFVDHNHQTNELILWDDYAQNIYDLIRYSPLHEYASILERQQKQLTMIILELTQIRQQREKQIVQLSKYLTFDTSVLKVMKCVEDFRPDDLTGNDMYLMRRSIDCYGGFINKQEVDKAIQDQSNIVDELIHSINCFLGAKKPHIDSEMWIKSESLEQSKMKSSIKQIWTAQQYNQAAIQLFNQCRYNEAAEKYSQAIHLEGKESLYWENRGLCFMAMNLNAFAIADFTEAENLNSKSAVAFINRAICYKIAEKYKEAISDFTSAIKLKPHEDLYDQRAECYCALGQFKKAIQDFTKSKNKSKASMRYYNRGKCYVMMNQSKEAIESFTKAIKKDPNVSLFYRSRAQSYYNIGQLQKSLKDLSEAIRLNPKDLSIEAKRQYLFEQLGQFQKSKISMLTKSQTNLVTTKLLKMS